LNHTIACGSHNSNTLTVPVSAEHENPLRPLAFSAVSLVFGGSPYDGSRQQWAMKRPRSLGLEAPPGPPALQGRERGGWEAIFEGMTIPFLRVLCVLRGSMLRLIDMQHVRLILV
jgi:hypothetical protein